MQSLHSLPPLPHTVLSWTLPDCVCVQTHPTTPYQPIPFQSPRQQGDIFPVFLKRKLGHRRGESHRLNVYTLSYFYFPAVTKQAIKSVGKGKGVDVGDYDLLVISLFCSWKDNTERRRVKISVNLLKLVWEFVEGGKRESKRGRDSQGKEQLRLKPGINIFQVFH